jgi:hypothetical protein
MVFLLREQSGLIARLTDVMCTIGTSRLTYTRDTHCLPCSFSMQLPSSKSPGVGQGGMKNELFRAHPLALHGISSNKETRTTVNVFDAECVRNCAANTSLVSWTLRNLTLENPGIPQSL